MKTQRTKDLEVSFTEEEKDTMITGYWIRLFAIFNALPQGECKTAKKIKTVLLDGIGILDKIIELEEGKK